MKLSRSFAPNFVLHALKYSLQKIIFIKDFFRMIYDNDCCLNENLPKMKINEKLKDFFSKN